MKMTVKERIARSQEILTNCGFQKCMDFNDIIVVFHASAMAGSRLSEYDNKILMNRNAVPKRWNSNLSRSGYKINSSVKNAYNQVVEYIKQRYNITPGRVLKLRDILSHEQSEHYKARKNFTDNEILRRYLRNLNDLRMHCNEMTGPEIYDFSFDMMYDFLDKLLLSKETLFLSLLIMYWIQRESELVPLAITCKKDEFINALDIIFEDTITERERKKEFRHFMRKLLNFHLKIFIKNASNDREEFKSRDRILNLIEAYPKHTARTMASCLGLSVQAVQKQIANLKKEKRLMRIGPDNGGHWKVIEKAHF